MRNTVGSLKEENRQRGRGRPKVLSDEQQRRIILGEAKRLFLERGYGQMTMGDIARRCQMSKRTLYRHFPHKVQLFAALVDEHRTTMLALPLADCGGSIEAQLETIFRVDIEHVDETERLAFVRAAMIEAQLAPEIGDILKEFGAPRAMELLIAWVERQMDTGRLVKGEPDIMARMLMDIVFGAESLKGGRDPEWADMSARKRHLKGAIAIFINGAGRHA